jgi:hypothetical protein
VGTAPVLGTADAARTSVRCGAPPLAGVAVCLPPRANSDSDPHAPSSRAHGALPPARASKQAIASPGSSCGHYCSLARAACGPRNLVPHPGAAPARTARHRTAGRSPSPFSNMCGHVGGGGGARASTHRPLARSSRARRRRRRTCAPGPRGSRPAPPRNLSRSRRCTCAAAGRNERVRDRKQDLCRRR